MTEKKVELGDGEPSPAPGRKPCKCGGKHLDLEGCCTKCGLPFWAESGAPQEVSPVGSVYEIRPRPDDPSCHVCGAQMVVKEWKCLSCGTKTEGDTRGLKAALQSERELRTKIVEFVNDTWLKDRPDVEDDGFGGGAVNPCCECGLRLMEVVRPGKVQCSLCG